MLSEIEYERLNQEAREFDQKFTALPPQEIISCLTAYTIVFQPAMFGKLLEAQEQTNLLLEEILNAVNEKKCRVAPSKFFSRFWPFK